MESTYISTGYKIGKRQLLRFPKAKYAVNIITCQLYTYLLLTMFNSQLCSYICISVEHHWFSLLIRCNSDLESLKHDMSLMKVYIHKCLTTSNFLATPLQANVNRQLHKIQTSLLFGASAKSRKQIKTTIYLPLCKPLFIVNVRVKGLLKFYWSTKPKRLTSKSGRGTCITKLYRC